MISIQKLGYHLQKLIHAKENPHHQAKGFDSRDRIRGTFLLNKHAFYSFPSTIMFWTIVYVKYMQHDLVLINQFDPLMSSTPLEFRSNGHENPSHISKVTILPVSVRNIIVLDSTNKPTTFKFHWFFGEV